MDVQTENMDPPPCESQSSGKIRKGFKLFGKRKPGNIFSIRSKGDGNNKSPVNRNKTLDGLSETVAPDSEQEPDKERGQEVSQGEMEQTGEETFGEDGVCDFSHARISISSVSSAKSLRFLSLLRGGQRGTGDRQIHTVSQPVGRQRRGLKGLFSNVKLKSKDKEDKEETPPSPLLMSSRANSVEIIKEDLTLTPKSQPRSLDSPEMENCETVNSLSTQDSPETVTPPQVIAGNVSRTNEHVPPLPTSEPPLVPGDNSLSSLLADISSLLTFDSISGGGDIIADVEAEWGKASNSISATGTAVTPKSTSLFSKPSISSPLMPVSVNSDAAEKPSPVAVPTTASTKSFTPLTTSSSSPIAKPSTIITSFTKSSTLTTYSNKMSSDSTPPSGPSTSVTETTFALTTGKPSTAPVTITSFSTATMSPPSMTIKSTPNSTSATTTTLPKTSSTVVKAPLVTPTLSSTVISASVIAAPIQMVPSVIKPSPVATSLAPAKTPPVTHSHPSPVAFTQPLSAKLDSGGNLNKQTSTPCKPFLSLAAGEAKAPLTVSPACTVSTKPSSAEPVSSSKMTTVPSSTATTVSVSVALSKPVLTSTQMDLNQTSPSLVTVPHLCPPSALTATQPIHSSVPTPSSTSSDKIPPMTKETVQVTLDKMIPITTPPAPTTHAVVSTASPTPPAPAQIQTCQAKAPPAPTQILVSVSEDPLTTHIQIPVAKEPHAQIPAVQSKTSAAPFQGPSTDAPALSVSKDSPAPIQTSASQSKAPLEPTSPPEPCPVASLPSTPASCLSEAPASVMMRGSGRTSVDGQLASHSSTGPQGAQTVQPKPDELQNESRMNLQGPSKERRTPHVKASGLSKIPVVGGGRAGKLPVRESTHVDDEASRDPPTPELEEERSNFNLNDAGSKEKISDVGANMLTSKRSQEERPQPPEPKVLTSLPRDSKIPVKYGEKSYTASQIPQAKEPPRTKIPVSKVPVRRVGNKPSAVGGSSQIRK